MQMTPGTTIHFLPDKDILKRLNLKMKLFQRLRELAFLNKNITIDFIDESEDYRENLHFSSGLIDFDNYVNKNKVVINEKPIYFEEKKDDVILKVAIQI